jgi:hypothetical protein
LAISGKGNPTLVEGPSGHLGLEDMTVPGCVESHGPQQAGQFSQMLIADESWLFEVAGASRVDLEVEIPGDKMVQG